LKIWFSQLLKIFGQIRRIFGQFQGNFGQNRQIFGHLGESATKHTPLKGKKIKSLSAYQTPALGVVSGKYIVCLFLGSGTLAVVIEATITL